MKPHVKMLAIVPFIIFSSCVKKDKTPNETDAKLFNMAEKTSGFTWFKNSSDYLDKSSGSGHSYPFLKTRYNAIAAAMLDSNGRIMEGVNFPEGSLIVKELYNSDKKLERYALLYKDGSSPDADDNAWVWGYINADKTVAVPASKQGTSCISCHAQENNIDYMLMNKYF
jgi:hypothetical protein